MAMSLSRSFRAMAACRDRPNCTSTSVPMVREESRDVGSPLGSKDSRPATTSLRLDIMWHGQVWISSQHWVAMSLSCSFCAMAACRERQNYTSTSVPMVRDERSDVGLSLGSSEGRPATAW